VLTLRTEAVTPGERDDLMGVAVVAVDRRRARGLDAAVQEGVQGVAVAGQQTAAVLCRQFEQEGLDDLGEADHAASLQRSTKLASSSSIQ
jgi:hypothetical protein